MMAQENRCRDCQSANDDEPKKRGWCIRSHRANVLKHVCGTQTDNSEQKESHFGRTEEQLNEACKAYFHQPWHRWVSPIGDNIAIPEILPYARHTTDKNIQ
jgi:hypothetical protein